MISRKLSAFCGRKGGSQGCPEQAGDESLCHLHHAVKHRLTAGDETGKKLWDLRREPSTRARSFGRLLRKYGFQSKHAHRVTGNHQIIKSFNFAENRRNE
jgi:hypothetical protein